MERSVNWSIPVAVLLGLSTFGVATWLMMSSANRGAEKAPRPIASSPKKNDEPPLPDAGARVAALPEPAPVKKATSVPSAAPPRRLVLLSGKVPEEAATEKRGFSPFRVVDLRINSNGTRLLTKSEQEVHCLDGTNGTILQTYRPGPPRWSSMKPTAQHIFLSPDARFVAIYDEHPSGEKDVALRVADTGQTTGTFRVAPNTMLYEATLPDAFTPAGDFVLIQGGKAAGPKVVYGISTSTGAGGVVDIPGRDGPQGFCVQLLPVPNEPMLLIYSKGGQMVKSAAGLSALDLRTQQLTPIEGIGLMPDHLFFDRAVQLSADGRLLLARGLESDRKTWGVQVCEWRKHRRVFTHSEARVHFGHSCFTPDAQRLLVVRRAEYYLIWIGGKKSGSTEHVPDTLELFDIASGERIADFTPDDHDMTGEITALTISGDGQKIAFACGTNVHMVDFHAAFDVAPLPPVPVSQAPYPLALRPDVEEPRQPRSLPARTPAEVKEKNQKATSKPRPTPGSPRNP